LPLLTILCGSIVLEKQVYLILVNGLPATQFLVMIHLL